MSQAVLDRPAQRGWYRNSDCRLAHFIDEVERQTLPEQVPLAAEIQRNIPVYDCAELAGALAYAEQRELLLAEWSWVLQHGAGTLVLRGAYADTEVIDRATAIFEAIIVQERAAGISGSDHFAKPGANDRIWNAQEKLCLADPAVYLRYFANPFIQAAAEAWLGPAYQMCSQVNVVRPGGAAQQAHRDYHLGFQTPEQVQRYPAHVHAMSAMLTLQGAVAHNAMPVASGPTKLLPFSQRYGAGYLAWPRAEFREYFESHYVQLPLAKGDALFFNPALFHAAGANRTADLSRMANLLQVSSAYGRAMESVDRTAMCLALYPSLRRQRTALGPLAVDAAIAATAEGYAFPTNLDRDPPRGGLAPPSQQDLLHRALAEDWSEAQLAEALQAQQQRRLTR